MMRNAGILALLIVVGALSWHMSRYVQPARPAPQVDTVRVKADAPADLDDEGNQPEQRIVYRTRTDTVQQACLSLPETYDTRRISLVQPRPVSIEGRAVTIDRYDVQDARYVQDVYRVPRERWALWPVVRTGLGQGWHATSAGARLRYRNLQASLAYTYSPDFDGLTIGIRWTPYTLRW
jgi:hypothetical protein